jgi:hypothetical protein
LQFLNKFGNIGPRKKFDYAKRKNWNEKIEKNVIEIWIDFFVLLKNWPYHQREMEKVEKKRFWNLKKFGHTTRGKWKKLKCATKICKKIWNEKFEHFHFWNLKWNFLFEIWKNWPYHWRNVKKIGNEEIIYFVYATEIKLPIIPLYHQCMGHRKRALICGGSKGWLLIAFTGLGGDESTTVTYLCFVHEVSTTVTYVCCSCSVGTRDWVLVPVTTRPGKYRTIA